MNNNDFTTITANAICRAWRESLEELEMQFAKTSIVQHPEMESRRRIDLENSFFNMVTAYRSVMSISQYEQLCSHIEAILGFRFVYRP